MKEQSPISNIDRYNTRMNKSLIDKLFFVDKINVDAILDYGCADGTMLTVLPEWMPETKLFVGYDIDLQMVELAIKKFSFKNPDFDYLITSEWENVISAFGNQRYGCRNNALVLSSIIHEVLHYSTPEQINCFWEKVFNFGFSYIVIRDMMPSSSVDRPSFTDDVSKVYNKFYGSKELLDFEKRWGSIENNKNLIHFLLKYKYVEPNWDREVRENYIPLYREEFLSKIPRNYNVIYHEHYPLPWLQKQIQNDFGFVLKDNTHIKMILEKTS